MNISSTLGIPHNICFETIPKRRRLDYSGAISDKGAPSSIASSSIGCNSPDRFLPTLTSRVPFFPHNASHTSRYAAELLSLVDSTYQPPFLARASSDPTLLARIYHAQSLNIKNTPVPSPYSAVQNARSKPDFDLDMGRIEQRSAVHPSVWSCRNVLATILCDDVIINNIEDCSTLEFDEFDPARSIEWLPDHSLAIGDVNGTIISIDANTGQVDRTWNMPLYPWEMMPDSAVTFTIVSLGFSRERNLLAAGRYSGSVTCTDRRMTSLAWSIKSALGPSTVRWSPDGLYLAIGSECGTIRCADIRTRKKFDLTLPQKQNRPAHKGASVTSLAWAPWESHLLASGGSGKDGMVHLWSLSGSDMSNKSHRHLQSSMFSSQVTSLHFSPHIRELLMTYGDAIKKRSIEAPKPPRHRRLSGTTPPILPPSRGMAVYSYPSLKRVYSADLHEGPIVDSVLSPDGTSLLTYGKDEQLRTWRVWAERKKEKPRIKLAIR